MNLKSFREMFDAVEEVNEYIIAGIDFFGHLILAWGAYRVGRCGLAYLFYFVLA